MHRRPLSCATVSTRTHNKKYRQLLASECRVMRPLHIHVRVIVTWLDMLESILEARSVPLCLCKAYQRQVKHVPKLLGSNIRIHFAPAPHPSTLQEAIFPLNHRLCRAISLTVSSAVPRQDMGVTGAVEES